MEAAFTLPNFSDAGGLVNENGQVLRPHRLMRSGTFSGLSSIAINQFTSVVPTGTYIDLRTPIEREIDGVPNVLQTLGWDLVSFPVRDKFPDDHGEEPKDFVRRYLVSMPLYVSAAELVVDKLEYSPVVLSCSLGKDRTGMVFALVLKWMGFDINTIVDDYLAVNSRLLTVRSSMPHRWRDPSAQFTFVDGDTMKSVLRAIESRSVGANPSEATQDTLLRVSKTVFL